MAIADQLNNNEKDKFRGSSRADTCVAVCQEDGSGNPVDVNTNVVASPATIKWIVFAAADTEVSYTFPANTRRFTMLHHSGNDTVRVAYETGKASEAGDPNDNEYYPLNPGNEYDEQEIDADGTLVVYAEAATAGQTLVLKSWQAP